MCPQPHQGHRRLPVTKPTGQGSILTSPHGPLLSDAAEPTSALLTETPSSLLPQPSDSRLPHHASRALPQSPEDSYIPILRLLRAPRLH